jgi:hypothetical protein
VIAWENRPMAKFKKNRAKLNLTVRDEQRNKLEQMAALIDISDADWCAGNYQNPGGK